MRVKCLRPLICFIHEKEKKVRMMVKKSQRREKRNQNIVMHLMSQVVEALNLMSLIEHGPSMVMGQVQVEKVMAVNLMKVQAMSRVKHKKSLDE